MLGGVSAAAAGGFPGSNVHRNDGQGHDSAASHERRADHGTAWILVQSAEGIVVDLAWSALRQGQTHEARHTLRNSSLGCVGPHFPHLAASSSSSWQSKAEDPFR